MKAKDCKRCPNVSKVRGRYYCGIGTPINKVMSCLRLMRLKEKKGEQQ